MAKAAKKSKKVQAQVEAIDPIAIMAQEILEQGETTAELDASEETVGELARRLTNADEHPFALMIAPEEPQEAGGSRELDEVIEQLDAVDAAQAEAVHVMPATEPVHVPPATEGETWEQALKEIPDNLVDLAVMSVARAFDERAAYEADKNPDNANIQRTLKKARAQLATKRATKAMLAAGFDEGQINRTKHEGARYNVYALGKLADVLYAVTDGAIQNAINNAVMRSLFKFRAAGKPFTMDMAKAACSAQIRVDAAVKAILVRHTVAPSTAPTQASSTMQALVDLGIVDKAGSEKNPVYTLTNKPIVAKLDAVLQAA